MVTILFATLGDGVEADGEGLRRIVLEHGHTLVWALMTASLTTAAVMRRWQRISGAFASAAVITYVVFLGAVLSGS